MSLSTGQFDHAEQDLHLADVIPITITRTYNSADKNQRAFGIGMTHAYDVFLFSQNLYQEFDLILPNGTRVHYFRTSSGTDAASAILQSSAPGPWQSSLITYNPTRSGWDLSFRDGRHWLFSLQWPQPLLEMSDANGNTTRILRRDEAFPAEVAQIISPNGRTATFTYTTSGFINGLTDNLGRHWSYNYDTGGRLVSVVDPLGGTRTYTWDTTNNRLTELHDTRGNLVVQNEYDSAGRVQRQTLADGNHFSYSYTTQDGVITQTDLTNQRGTVRRVEFNAVGNIVRNTFALGLPEEQITTYELSNGQLTASVDPLNRRTEYLYDSAGNTTRVTRLAGTTDAAITTMTYDPVFAKRLTITDPNGNTTTRAYDAQGNLLSIIDALGHRTVFSYDNEGRRLMTTDPLGKITTLTYDGADVASVTDPLGRRLQYLNDAGGRILSMVDPLGNRIVYNWDDLSRLLSSIDPLGGVTSYTYDGNGNMLSHIDANGHTTNYQYTALNAVQSMQDALGKQETSSYDVDGRLRQKIDRKGQLRSVTYDGLGRIRIVGFGATAAQPTAFTSKIEYTWDVVGRMTQVIESTCNDPVRNPGCSSAAATTVITRNYDGLDRMISETTPQGEVDYTYDGAGRRTSMTIKNGPPGAQITQPMFTYTYDNANRLVGIRQAAGSVNAGVAQTIAFTYDAAGHRTQLTLANGSVVSYTYDDAGQVMAIVSKRNNGTFIGDLQYEYDAAGHRTSVGGSLARLTVPSSDVMDAMYDVNNRLLMWAGRPYAYDDNGNMVNNGTNEFRWDDRDRLTSIRSTGSQIANFQYDIFGRRVAATIGSVTTGFLYDGPNIAQELDGISNTAMVRTHLVTGAVDEVFLRLEGNDGANLQSVFEDANNSTVMLLDAVQNSIVRYAYEPYGMTSADGANTNRQQYTNRENDNPGNSEGLYYYRARYYMPGIARFITEDPIGWASGQTNNYAYAGGDPIDLRDPTGFDTDMGGPGGGGGPQPPPSSSPPPDNSPPPPPPPPLPSPPSPPPLSGGAWCRIACWGASGGICVLGTKCPNVFCMVAFGVVCGGAAQYCTEKCPL